MKTACISAFIIQAILVASLIVIRAANNAGLLEEEIGKQLFDCAAITIVALTPLSFGSATVSFMALAKFDNTAWNKMLSEQIDLGYPITWLLWREVKEKYGSVDGGGNV